MHLLISLFVADLPAALLSLMSIADQARRREALKQQMALAAQHLLSEPDKHIGPGASQWGFGGRGGGGEKNT
jgi:hypothetical protein